jgi:hypothetical protein
VTEKSAEGVLECEGPAEGVTLGLAEKGSEGWFRSAAEVEGCLTGELLSGREGDDVPFM